MERLCILVKVTDKAYDPLRLMILDILRSVPSSILKMDGKLRIQIGSLMKTALYICCSESCFLKNLRIRKEIDTGSGTSGLPSFGEKSCFQFNGRDSSLIVVMMYITITTDLNIQIRR